MTESLKIKSGDLYPNGDLRKRILDDRVRLEMSHDDRSAWKKAKPIALTIWSTELYGDISIGDKFKLEDQDPFSITGIKVKHGTENSYILEFHGHDGFVSFKAWGNENIEIIRNK